MTEKKKIDFGEFDFGQLIQTLTFEVTFWLAALLLFFKTADLASEFAPTQIMGFVGVEHIYGFAVALTVEGALVASKYGIKSSVNGLSFAWSFLLILITFGLSAAAQVFDGLVSRELLLQQPVEVQLVANYGVPLIPALVLLLLLVKNVFDALPEDTARNLFSRRKAIKVEKSDVFSPKP